MKKLFYILLIFGILCQAGGAGFADFSKPLKVVATQALYADLVRKIGGDLVEVKSIASPKFNIHFIQPKPSDIRYLSKADLYVHNGLDLELWSDPLVEAVGKPQFFRGAERSLDLSKNIQLAKVPTRVLSRSEGDMHLFGNPHYHMDPSNLLIMASTVADKLIEIDSANAASYQKNKEALIAQLDKKIAEWKELCSHCKGQEILSYHDDIEYLARFFGVRSEQFLEPKPGIPPSPKHLEFLENYVKDRGIRAILLPTYFSKEITEKFASRVGAKVGVVAQNAGEIQGTEDLFGFFDYNVKVLSQALK